jgi:hypothetical protein
MARTLQWLLALALGSAAAQVSAQVRIYEHDNFGGRSFTANGPVGDFARHRFNDRASSVIVRGGSWQLCDNARFGGRCVVLRPGRYPSLSAMGMNDRVSSLRPAGPPRYPRR